MSVIASMDATHSLSYDPPHTLLPPPPPPTLLKNRINISIPLLFDGFVLPFSALVALVHVDWQDSSFKPKVRRERSEGSGCC